MKGVTAPAPFQIRPDGEIPVEFRFSIKSAREMERFAGCNYTKMLADTRQIEAVCMMVCYGLRHEDPKLTVDKAADLVDAFVEKGGNIIELYLALQKAMDYSGVYGPPLKDEDTPRPPTPAEAPALT